MDPLHIAIALGPLAVYTLLMGMLNLFRRPFLTTGARDTAALGIAVSGFVIAGPMELFLPESAVILFGPLVWVLLLAFYTLCLTLVVLLMRPRLIIYNATYSQVRPLLSDLSLQLDKEARWAGENLMLPQLGVQLTIESFPPLRNVQLVSAGPNQSYAGWRRLEVAMAAALRETSVQANPYGVSLLVASGAMTTLIGYYLLSDREGVASALFEMLRL